jgi:hypothetical protein
MKKNKHLFWQKLFYFNIITLNLDTFHVDELFERSLAIRRKLFCPSLVEL